MMALSRTVAGIEGTETLAFIKAVDFFTQRISKKTQFLFVRVSMSNGAQGWGEATFNSLNEQVLVALRQLSSIIADQSIATGLSILGLLPTWKSGRASLIGVNALQCALLDVLAQMRDLPLYAVLGEKLHDHVPCYANINRGTKTREPHGWADRAQAAVNAGFPAVKLAPFDKISLGLDGKSVGDATMGLECAHAVKDTIGVDAELMLDCHWRFDEQRAQDLLHACADLDLKWVEAPILEDALSIPSLNALKKIAEENGTKLAGGEILSGVRAFAPFLHTKAFHVMNPDPRFCGVMDMSDIAMTAAKFGVQIAPHNHLGPIMTAASLHIAAIAPSALTIELQFAEGDEPPCVEKPDLLKPQNGRIQVPTDAGLGIAIQTPMLCHVQ